MTFVSRLAMAAAVTAGLMTAPAVAQKKKKEDAAAAQQLKLSDGVRKPVAAAQTALQANDVATATTQLDAAQAAATTDDEKYIVNALRLNLVAKSNDNAKMLPVLDALIVNPRTPAADLGRFNYFRGALPFQEKKYKDALPYLLKARELGYTDSSNNLPLQLAQAYIETGNVAAGTAEIEKAVQAETAAGRKPPEAWYNYAVAKAYGTGDRAQTAKWLQAQIKMYPTPQNWRKAILVYRDGAEQKGGKPLDRGQRIDLFRLMRATKSLADQGDYLEYADAALLSGLPYETKAVLDEGRTTGKIPAGNANATRLATEADASIKADKPLAALEKQAAAAPNGKLASQTADAYFAQSNFAKALELYKLAQQKGGVDPSEVNLRIGMALTQSGQHDAAKAAFQQVTTAPRSDMAGFWQQWIDLAAAAPAAAAPASE